MKPEQRTYRSLVSDKKLASFRVLVKETDLFVRADKSLERETTELVVKHRMPLERYIERHPEFVRHIVPVPKDPLAPPIVKTMISAGRKAGVGPMAAVAGAIAEYVGQDLLAHAKNVIVENGGDVFLKTDFPLMAAIYAGIGGLGLAPSHAATRMINLQGRLTDPEGLESQQGTQGGEDGAEGGRAQATAAAELGGGRR